MIEEIKNHVKEQCASEKNFFTMAAYDTHFVPMVKFAKLLAEKRNANLEVVEIAAWLHDIGGIMGDYENHHLSGAEYAERYLERFDLSKGKIDNIKHCIIAHRASKDIPRETIEAECIADADAMSHFDNIGALFNLALNIRKLNIEDSKEFVLSKIERSWNKMTPLAQKMIKEKYEAVKILLD